MGSALDTIKKKGYFKTHSKANKAYVEQRKLVKHVKATLAKLDGTTSKETGSSKKPSKRQKEATATAGQPDSNLQLSTCLNLRSPKKL
jgi:hypothetical protein